MTWVAKQFGKEFELKGIGSPFLDRPDVLLWNSRDGYLFIDDAKNADNESPGKQETIQRDCYVDNLQKNHGERIRSKEASFCYW